MRPLPAATHPANGRKPHLTSNERQTGKITSEWREITGQCGEEGSASRSEKQYYFFVRNRFAGRVKARPADRTLARDVQRRAFTPAVILFIALLEANDNIDPG
jgi:hypothetical protein